MTNEVTYVAQSAAHELYNVFGTIASGVFASVNIASLRRVRVVSQIKELPLAHVGFSFPRLSFDTWDQGEQIFAMTDAIAERARKLGGATVRSIGPISRSQRIADKRRGIRQAARDAGRTSGRDSGSEHARDTFACDEAGDVATASLLEEWIDETEKRTWFFLDCP